MPHSFDAYGTSLVNDILLASSQGEVEDLIAAAIIALEQKETLQQNRLAIAGRLKDELDLFNPFNKDAQQWNNIKLAKILLNRYMKDERMAVTGEE